jgi:hypothetical protein
MRLTDIATTNTTVRFNDIGLHPDLCRNVQERLSALGLLDPPADGKFGPVSRWALSALLGKIDRDIAARLLNETADGLFPVAVGDELASRLVKGLAAKGHWLARHPDCVNIVYVEAMNPDGSANDNRPNRFNDSRFILRVDPAGRPELAGTWDATTEPGRFWTQNPMNPMGAARIAFGQYKAWSVGTHNASKPSGHEALVQTQDITVHRDLNQDFSRAGDATDTGLFGVNQHWGYDNPQDDIGTAGAGCLVGRTKNGHRAFMKLVKADPRYVVNNSYRFMTAILDAAAVPR